MNAPLNAVNSLTNNLKPGTTRIPSQQIQVLNDTSKTEVSLKEPIYAVARSVSNIGDSLSKDSILSFLQTSIVPWLGAIFQAFGKSNFWADIASSLGILWNSIIEFQSKGLAPAVLEFSKLATLAGLGGKYGIPMIKENIAKINNSFFKKNWVQVLGGLMGVVFLQKLGELFDNYLKKGLSRFLGSSEDG